MPAVKTPGRGNGAGVGEAGDVSNIEANFITPGATEIEIAQRRAESLRLQAIGQIGGA